MGIIFLAGGVNGKNCANGSPFCCDNETGNMQIVINDAMKNHHFRRRVMLKGNALVTIFIVITAAGCRKPYNPSVTTAPTGYLVVEGVINTGPDSTIIKLSRTVALSAVSTTNPELNAQVSIENDQNNSYPLVQLSNGNYGSPALNLGNSHQYRLMIKTANGEEYVSDFVEAKNSPAIDSITYQYADTCENIYSYTHDPTNNTHYYRWDYVETYLYTTPFQSLYLYTNGNINRQTPANQISTCYVTDNSSNVIINSSAKLRQDLIYKNPVTQVSFNLDKLKIRYSILVRQYALTADEYVYYQNLKTNTENLGSIFDAQPSSPATNINCVTHPNEIVVGYISAGTVSQQRIFIDRSDIPPTLIGAQYDCSIQGQDVYYNHLYPLPIEITSGQLIPTDTIVKTTNPKSGDSLFYWQYTTPACADCLLKGTNVKPSFWH
jgi:hypothetical protein